MTNSLYLVLYLMWPDTMKQKRELIDNMIGLGL